MMGRLQISLAIFFKMASGNLYPNCNDRLVRNLVNHQTCTIAMKYLMLNMGIRNNLKLEKAAGIDCIVAEHIIYAHPAVVMHLTKLFNLMLIHGYVPQNFGHSIIIPLIKDRCGDASPLANYCLLYTSPSPRDRQKSRMPSSA